MTFRFLLAKFYATIVHWNEAFYRHISMGGTNDVQKVRKQLTSTILYLDQEAYECQDFKFFNHEYFFHRTIIFMGWDTWERGLGAEIFNALGHNLGRYIFGRLMAGDSLGPGGKALSELRAGYPEFCRSLLKACKDGQRCHARRKACTSGIKPCTDLTGPCKTALHVCRCGDDKRYGTKENIRWGPEDVVLNSFGGLTSFKPARKKKEKVESRVVFSHRMWYTMTQLHWPNILYERCGSCAQVKEAMPEEEQKKWESKP